MRCQILEPMAEARIKKSGALTLCYKCLIYVAIILYYVNLENLISFDKKHMLAQVPQSVSF